MELRWPDLSEFLRERASLLGARPALTIYRGAWHSLSFRELEEAVRAHASALTQSGHGAGDRVAYLAVTGPELLAALLGAPLSGAVAIPLDAKLAEAELLAVLRHAEPRALVVSEGHRELGLRLADAAGLEKLLFLEALRPLADAGLAPREPASGPEEPAAIFYTSGTLAQPKGVMVSTAAILAELTMLTQYEENHPGDVIYSILPLSHLYGFVAGALYSLACGAEYVFAHSLEPAEIARALNERRVTQMNVVPLLLNLLRRGIERRLAEQPPARRKLTRALLRLAPSLPLSVRRRLFRPVHEKLGGALRRSVSGAAPLDPATFDFFRAIGAPVYEGYGLTETGPVITVNTSRHVRRGFAGRALPGVELKLASDGEVLTRGPHLMLGYFREPELTREAFDDGWFRTGDLGTLRGGYLQITGRKKSLVVLASGKKVHAEEVERALARSPLFSDVCVLGLPGAGQGELLAAVVVPSAELSFRGPELTRAAEREVKERCRELAAHKQPARVIVRTEPLAKTSSGKVRRHVVYAQVTEAP